MLRLWNFSRAILSCSFILSLLDGLPLCEETRIYLSLQLSVGIWVICFLLSVVFLLTFGSDRGHWKTACTLGGTVGSQSIATQFCTEMVPVYPPSAVPENFGVSQFSQHLILPCFTDALRAAEWCYHIVVGILSWWIMTLIPLQMLLGPFT